MAKFKLSENWGSTLLGFIVVLILGGFLLNVFRGDTNKQEGEISESAESTEQSDSTKTYIVKSSESLWVIAEQEYGSGYNWVSIAEANNLESADDIEEGQELIIPNVKPILVGAAAIAAASAVGDAMEERQAQDAGQVAGTDTDETSEDNADQEAMNADSSVISDTSSKTNSSNTASEVKDVTVQPGDTLWSIAWIVYGDAYRWSEIAQANNLANPDMIEVGTLLIIPQ